MLRMRLSLMAAAALSLAPGLASANELLNVYQLAVEHDMTIAAAGFARDAALQARPLARAALLPLITGTYVYNRGRSEGESREVEEIETPVTDANGNPVLNSDGTPQTVSQPFPFVRDFNTNDTNKNLSINLTQPIFNWSAFMTYSKSADQLALAQATYRSAEQDLMLRTAQAYFNYLAANDDLRYTGAQKSSLDRQLEQAKKRFEVGLAAITDVQESQASYDLTLANVIAADQSLAAAREALLEITGQPDARLVPLQDEIPLPGPQPDNVDEWLASARDNNFDLAIAKINATLAGRDVSIARAGHYPTVSLVGQYVNTNQQNVERDSDVGSQSITDRGPNIGVQVNVPIFSGLLVQTQTRQAESVEQQRQAQVQGSQRSVAHTTRNAFLAVLSGSARVRALKQAVVSNQSSLEASQTGLEVGTRTTVDVLTAQSLLFSAQRDYARSRYDYLIAILTLKSAAGRLTQADLAEIDQLLVSG